MHCGKSRVEKLNSLMFKALDAREMMV